MTNVYPLYSTVQDAVLPAYALAADGATVLPGNIYDVRGFGAKGDGVTDDTGPIGQAVAAASVSGGTVFFPAGTYLTKDLLIRSASNFVLRGDRGSVIYHTGNSVAAPSQATHDVCIIADCTDFSVDGLTFNARRDSISADQFLTANAASGQKNITVQDGTKYFIGEAVTVFGGLTANGGTEKNFTDTNNIITAIAGNVLTLTTNLANSYTGTGASGGAYCTQYQTGGAVAYSIAGRNLGNEDAQNGLHLMNCQRFVIRNCTFLNTWESPLKLGTGFQTSSPTDGCTDGIITGSMSKHGFDQGISVWNCQNITVDNNWCYDAGWAGISLTHSNDCTVSANVCTNNLYSPASDLNEGTGIAVEGGVRCIVQGNVCSSNNSNGIRLSVSPMYGGAAEHTTVAASHSAGDTSLVVGSAANIVNGADLTYVDHTNNMIRENIHVTNVTGTTLTISPALRNNYVANSDIYARFGEDCLISGNNCALNALGAGIKADQQIALKVFANDCSKNGFSGGSFVDTLGTYGIHLHSFCQQAIVEANTCSFNSEEGIVIDNDCRAVAVQFNECNSNGIKGTNQKNGIKFIGPQDSAAIGNICNFNTATGIYITNGSVSTQRNSLIDNTALYNNNSGIFLDNAGQEFMIQGNTIAYNGDTGIKVSGYKNSIFSLNKCYNQGGQEGIRFDDNGANFCLDNKVVDNMLYDDQGGGATQSWGIRELNNTARTILRGNYVAGNTNAAQVSLAATSALVSDLSYRTATAADYTVLFTDDVIGVTSTASARVVTLPAASAVPGRVFVVKDESGGANTHNITVKATSGTLDGVAAATGVAITANYGVARWYSNGTNWFSM
jgi:parallel beta-helix repeat protein